MITDEEGIVIARTINEYHTTVKSLQCKCTRARQLSESASLLAQRLKAASEESQLVGLQDQPPIIYTTEEEVLALESGIKQDKDKVLRLERELIRLRVPLTGVRQ